MRFSGAALADRRKAAGLSREELATRVQRSHATVVSWELERTRPGIDKLSDLASVLDCEVVDLLRADPQPERVA